MMDVYFREFVLQGRLGRIQIGCHVDHVLENIGEPDWSNENALSYGCLQLGITDALNVYLVGFYSGIGLPFPRGIEFKDHVPDLSNNVEAVAEVLQQWNIPFSSADDESRPLALFTAAGFSVNARQDGSLISLVFEPPPSSREAVGRSQCGGGRGDTEGRHPRVHA